MSKSGKMAGALVLGVLSFFLMFLLGEGVSIPATIRAAKYIEVVIFMGGMGGYFFVSEFLLSRGNAKATIEDWPVILALISPLLITVLIVLIVEPNKLAVLPVVGAVILAVACSFAGAALAARLARHRSYRVSSGDVDNK
jgi:hypothetical protein